MVVGGGVVLALVEVVGVSATKKVKNIQQIIQYHIKTSSLANFL